MTNELVLRRRQLLKASLGGAGLLALGGMGALGISRAAATLYGPDGRPLPLPALFGSADAASVYTEVFPTSPLILRPFVSDELKAPQPLRPVPESVYKGWATPPDIRNGGQQDSDGGKHQIPAAALGNVLVDPKDPNKGVKALVYHIKVQLGEHQFTSSPVLPIGSDGRPVPSYDEKGNTYAAGAMRALPNSTIFGFAGRQPDGTYEASFPGPMINAEYGRAVLVRFENNLKYNPLKLNQGDFGAPALGFLTHLHNGHTAPESDGNPNYRCHQKDGDGGWGVHPDFPGVENPKSGGYLHGDWVDNLYLNWPAGGDDREKQSFFWFHDHYHNHTGANVYKGMVGLYPIYDPGSPSLGANFKDNGRESEGLKLPGVRSDYGDGSFKVDYDIPLAFFDVRLDDGNTVHQDMHGPEYQKAKADYGWNGIAPNKTHPELWGQSFFKHFANHGFVGDIFTVNGTAYPYMTVKRRKYRFRMLDASVSRIYEFKLMTSANGPKAAKDLGYGGDELQGQWRIPDGKQVLKWTEIATDGGLLTKPIVRDSFELWPAKRREFVVDFSKLPSNVSEVYLTNVMKMKTGRMWDSSDPNYKVPVLKFVVEGSVADGSNGDLSAEAGRTSSIALRPLPPLPDKDTLQKVVNARARFRLERGSTGGENEWLINGQEFSETKQFASVRMSTGSAQNEGWVAWEIQNGGGGWVHPLHIHQEEHQVVMRNGKWIVPPFAAGPDARHPDDKSREDVVALDPSESVVFIRRFRDFRGKYVAHCHNLAHEDHSMMFGWEIV